MREAIEQTAIKPMREAIERFPPVQKTATTLPTAARGRFTMIRIAIRALLNR